MKGARHQQSFSAVHFPRESLRRGDSRGRARVQHEYNRAMRAGLVVLAAAMLAGGQTPGQTGEERLKAILSRVSEEAEVFLLAAPNLVGQETFQQRAAKAPRRFRPRLGSAAIQVPKPQYSTREIVSEYGYSVLRGAPGQLHEFRQIVSIDGRQIRSVEKARTTLTLGLKSADDRVKKRMVEDFKRHGLAEAAADFGPLILLFGKRRLGDYSLALSGSGRIGAEAALIVSFRQVAGTGSLLIFEKRKALRQPLEGEVWVRQPDWLPLRIGLRSSRKEETYSVRDEATVDYVLSPHGVLVPVSVVHRQFAGDELVVENLFRYSPFRKFTADTEIKFN